jgi:hypothetical protein
MRKLVPVLVGALLLAPLGIGAVQLFAELRAEPRARVADGSAARMDVAVDAGPGREFAIEAPSSAAVAYVQLVPATYATHPRASFAVCVSDRCREERVPRLSDGEPIALPLPPAIRGGPVRIRVEEVRGGHLAFWGGPEAPGVTWLRPGSWAERVARASAYAGAFGVASFGHRLVFHVSVLLAIALGALAAAARSPNPAGRAHPAGSGAGPGAHDGTDPVVDATAK